MNINFLILFGVWGRWGGGGDDRFPKPSYLFALVAGKLNTVSDKYVTKSGRLIDIKIYVEIGDEKYTQHAITSLKKAMKWDENVYGLEYDLAVSSASTFSIISACISG